MDKFAITIKINKRWPTADDYYELLAQLYQDSGILVEDLIFEEDQRHRLHIHGWFESPNIKFSITQLCKKFKVHIYIKKMSTDGWISYINKTKPTRLQQEELITKNTYYHEYMFKAS